MLQSSWRAIINPVLSNPLTNPRIIAGVKLVSGTNVINHQLQAMQQGWVIADTTAAATIYRSQPFNDLTLTLVASAPTVVTLVVY
jgi:hypothetical protein